VDFCSDKKAYFWFNPVQVWGLNTTSSGSNSSAIFGDIFPKTVTDALKVYQKVAKFMFIVYILAFVSTVIEIIVGFAAIFSRWGSLATTIVSSVSYTMLRLIISPKLT
jgi:ABC-type phosphate/phosphonate transport system permease subunit